jgi:hypothetical protein
LLSNPSADHKDSCASGGGSSISSVNIWLKVPNAALKTSEEMATTSSRGWHAPPRVRTLCTSLGITLQHGLSDPRGWPFFPTSESRQLTERIYYKRRRRKCLIDRNQQDLGSSRWSFSRDLQPQLFSTRRCDSALHTRLGMPKL